MAVKFEAREITPDEFEVWDKLVSNYGSIFQTIKWTSIFEPNIKRIGIFDRGGQMIGGFVYYETAKMGLRVIRNPFYTPIIGPFFKKRAKNKTSVINELRDIVESMVNFFRSKHYTLITVSLAPEMTDTLPFYWDKYKVNVYYTFRIDLNENDENKLFKNMSVKTRNDIRKAERDGIIVIESNDTEILKKLVDKTFRRQNKKFPKDFMERILNVYRPVDNSFLFISWKNEKPIAAVYCVYDNKVAYNLITGYDYEQSHHGAQALAIYKAILKARSLGLKIFDFEGSMVKSIEKFFRGFGGDLVPYYRISKAPLLVELGLKFFKRQIF